MAEKEEDVSATPRTEEQNFEGEGTLKHAIELPLYPPPSPFFSETLSGFAISKSRADSPLSPIFPATNSGRSTEKLTLRVLS